MHPPTDMRRSFDELSALARNELGTDPASGNWFVFVNRRRTMMKVLAFDGDGYWIWSKRLEAGQFATRGETGTGKVALSRTAFRKRSGKWLARRSATAWRRSPADTRC